MKLKNITDFCKEKGLSDSSLAKALGMKRQNLYRCKKEGGYLILDDEKNIKLFRIIEDKEIIKRKVCGRMEFLELTKEGII